MRGVILILSLLASLLLLNIVAYSLSEDYRFFVKKIKYQQEVVENPQIIDDSEQYILTPPGNIDENIVVQSEKVDEDIFFLDVLRNSEKVTEENDFPEMFRAEEEVLERFEKWFIIREIKGEKDFLFGLTDEYPDEYREYANAHFSLYMFPTKSYTEIKNIFEILRYDFPYSLNEINNFGSASFYINMDELYEDNYIRIVFEYENLAFWLKIKKDSYNEAKSILETF